MSPGVLADLWKEEEQKTKVLEERMKGLLREKGVSCRSLSFQIRYLRILSRFAIANYADLIIFPLSPGCRSAEDNVR